VASRKIKSEIGKAAVAGHHVKKLAIEMGWRHGGMTGIRRLSNDKTENINNISIVKKSGDGRNDERKWTKMKTWKN
jgi:hypothetical protein